MIERSHGRLEADNWHYKAHAEDGIHFLGSGVAAPEANYYGFTVTGQYTAIASITYIDDTLMTGDITDITLVQGMYYPIPFKTITLTEGDMMLFKYNS